LLVLEYNQKKKVHPTKRADGYVEEEKAVALTSVFMFSPIWTRIVMLELGIGFLQEGLERVCTVSAEINKDVARLWCEEPMSGPASEGDKQ
jgi:hypothetical protein